MVFPKPWQRGHAPTGLLKLKRMGSGSRNPMSSYLQMKRSELDQLGQYDCIVIVTDHSDYDYKKIVGEAQLVVDTRNATKGMTSPKVVRC